jgi:hypothetical protein
MKVFVITAMCLGLSSVGATAATYTCTWSEGGNPGGHSLHTGLKHAQPLLLHVLYKNAGGVCRGKHSRQDRNKVHLSDRGLAAAGF